MSKMKIESTMKSKSFRISRYDNIHDIATTIENFLDHPQESKEMGDCARQFILNNYTWDKIASKMISVYENIIQSYNLWGIPGNETQEIMNHVSK